MLPLLSVIALSAAVFATTNLDDLLLLTAFFASDKMTTKSIVVGQYLGLSALTAGSVVAAMLAINVHTPWLGALGLAPFILGVRALILLQGESDEQTLVAESRELATVRPRSQWVTVALVTLANGGDNLGVYIPLFSKTASNIPTHIVVFAIMTGVWCLLSHRLVHHRVLGSQIRRYGRIALPIVLMSLGISLMWGLRDLAR